MSESYELFMMYALDDDGERIRLDVSDEGEVGKILDPEQVFVIVKEEIRRIYIWQGAKSPVRKRFISSRVAQALQEELVKQAAFHRCKIVSVDQGDEVDEFLKAFNLESMEVTEKLADVRYIRNVDREKMLDQGIIPEEGFKVVAVEKGAKEKSAKSTTSTKKTTPTPKQTASVKRYMPPPMKSYGTKKAAQGMAESEKKAIMEKIIKEDLPKNTKRQNLIIGHTLYGAVSKTVTVFGKEIEETEWEIVQKVPKGMMEIDNRILRVYFNEDLGNVEALEILEIAGGKAKKSSSIEEKTDVKSGYNKWVVKDLRSECIKRKLKIPVNAKKVDLVKLLVENDAKKKPAPGAKRKLPSIPKG